SDDCQPFGGGDDRREANAEDADGCGRLLDAAKWQTGPARQRGRHRARGLDQRRLSLWAGGSPDARGEITLIFADTRKSRSCAQANTFANLATWTSPCSTTARSRRNYSLWSWSWWALKGSAMVDCSRRSTVERRGSGPKSRRTARRL